MSPAKDDEQFLTFLSLASTLYKANEADALLVMLSRPVDWGILKKKTGRLNVVLVASDPAVLEGADDDEFSKIVVDSTVSSVYDKLNQALLDGLASDLLSSGSDVVAIFNAFGQERRSSVNSVSFIRLDERLGRLSSRELRSLETQVPLETLKLVVDLAVEIGRDGREGKPVGTMIVVGDHRKVMEHSRSIGFDPVKGYKQAERNLHDSSVREAVKEAALMDGAFVVSSAGIVVAGCQLLETGGTGSITLSKGLGTRHWAGAAISQRTKAIAVVVSESNGSVRIFQNGEVMLRIEPTAGPGRRPMTWKELDPGESTDEEKDDGTT